MKKKLIIFITGIIAVICVIVVSAFMNGATSSKKLSVIAKAEKINQSTQHLIGKETKIDLTDKSMKEKDSDKKRTSNIIKSMADNDLIFDRCSVFKTKSLDDKFVYDGFIFPNGEVVILTNTNGKGWKLKKGEKIQCKFEKYPCDFTDTQNLSIGYIVDGVAQKSDDFTELNGIYSLEAKTDGEYFIYFLNSSSDNISLKENSISVK